MGVNFFEKMPNRGSELRHGTGKPMMVLYKDEGDFVVIAGVVVEERKVEGEMNRSIFKPRINARLIYLFKQIITLHSKFKNNMLIDHMVTNTHSIMS